LAAASNAAELVSLTPAAPATPTTTPPPSGDLANAARVPGASQVPAIGRSILLEAGQGTLIRLPRPDTAGDEHRPRRLDEHDPAQQPAPALTRLENMIGMSGISLPSRALRTRTASAIHMIVQVNRMRDGHSRVTHLMEAVGTEGDVILITLVMVFVFAPVAMLAGGQHLLPGVLIGAGLGTLIPHYLIGRMGRKRVAAFIALFPEAIDLMVRALRSGLPISSSNMRYGDVLAHLCLRNGAIHSVDLGGVATMKKP
jgi:hypothetical protein